MDINKKIQAASHSGAKLRVTQDNQNYLVEKSITSAIEKNYLGIKNSKTLKRSKHHLLTF